MHEKTDRFLKMVCVVLSLISVIALMFFLGQLWTRGDPDIQSGRMHKGMALLHPISRTEEQQDGTPLGTVIRYRFQLKDLTRDTNLEFFTTHQYASVYLDGEQIYTSRSGEESPVRTPGRVWVIVPIYREDAGKELMVEITPVYENNWDQAVEFYLGSEFALLYSQLRWNAVPLALCGVLILAGIMILIMCTYWIMKKRECLSLFSLGVAALTHGLWRLLENRFLLLLVPEKPALLFYISLSMMMITVIPLAISLRRTRDWFNNIGYGVFALGTELVLIGQLMMELFGPLELWQMLPVTHVIMGIGVVLILVNTLASLSRKNPDPFSLRKLMPLLYVVGVAADLLYYHLQGATNGLMFTLTAFIAYVLITCLDFVRDYNDKDKALAETELQLEHSRITVMMNQIRSHFIFNVLNAISGMCKYDPEKADRTVVCFARYLRTNIDIMQDDDLVTFHAALRHIEDYMELEQIRFGEDLRFRTDIQVEHFMMPPMLMQPLVENAIRHGLNPKPEGGTITLRTRQEQDWIRVEIIDDGVGFDTEQNAGQQSVGIRNVRFRLEHMVNGYLEIRSTPGQGTTATILIPQKEAKL